MWKLYDELYIGIPSGIRISGCVVGEKWTTVRIDGNVGFARTLEYPENAAEYAAGFVGAYLRDTACHLRWDSLTRAAVGVAAMNAWYNTPERAVGLGGVDAKPAELKGKTAVVGMHGDFPIPMSPDFDVSAYEGLKGCDNIIIKSMALTTRALPGLLEIAGERAKVILAGRCTPLSALFFAFDMPIREIRGFYSHYPDTIEACAIKDIEDISPGVLPFTVRPDCLL